MQQNQLVLPKNPLTGIRHIVMMMHYNLKYRILIVVLLHSLILMVFDQDEMVKKEHVEHWFKFLISALGW